MLSHIRSRRMSWVGRTSTLSAPASSRSDRRWPTSSTYSTFTRGKSALGQMVMVARYLIQFCSLSVQLLFQFFTILISDFMSIIGISMMPLKYPNWILQIFNFHCKFKRYLLYILPRTKNHYNRNYVSKCHFTLENIVCSYRYPSSDIHPHRYPDIRPQITVLRYAILRFLRYPSSRYPSSDIHRYSNVYPDVKLPVN